MSSEKTSPKPPENPAESLLGKLDAKQKANLGNLMDALDDPEEFTRILLEIDPGLKEPEKP